MRMQDGSYANSWPPRRGKGTGGLAYTVPYLLMYLTPPSVAYSFMVCSLVSTT